jgi:LPS sulfotransferase NodH
VRVASTDNFALRVIQSRLFSMLLGSAEATRQEAAEFNALQPAPAAEAQPPARPIGTETVTLELPHVELPTVEVPRIEATAVMRRPVVEDEPERKPEPKPEPHGPPTLERPIVILSAPRAGSTLLFETLAQAAGVYTIGGESHQLIESIAALRPGRGVVSSNRLTRRDATSAIVEELRKRFAGRIRDRDGQAPPAGAAVRLLEKTPKNALRVPFLLEVFPDAQFIFLHREPRANLSSMMEAWRTKGFVTYRQLPGWPGPWSLLLPPGHERLQGKPLEEIVAFQWRVANETILDDLADFPHERWMSVRYEDLLRDPQAEVARLLEFIGLGMDPRLEAYLSKPLPPSRYTQTKPDPEKWRKNAKEIERVLPTLTDVSGRLAGSAPRRDPPASPPA